MKATLRLPDDLMDALRRRSQEEGRSLNATALAALRRGLGQEQIPHSAAEVLGSFIARPATKSFDRNALQRDLEGIDTSGLEEALEWTRNERD